MALEDVDSEVAKALEGELDRQRYKLNLIASENYASKAVLEAQGCIMTNKYAEGYPGRRYYGGCEFVDVAEELAIERAKKLFNCDHVNVQPHSGSQANMAVYFGLLELGDMIMGMDLNHGGHLSHGSKVSFSGKYFNIVHYGVEKETGRIDYANVAEIAREAKPKLIVCGASAYPREIDFKAFREIADEVGAILMADIAHIAGLIVAGVHQSPVGHAQVITTTTHKTLRGPRGGMIMCDEEYAQPINKTVFPGVQGGPLMHVIAAKAVAFKEALSDEFKKYNVQIVKNAKAIASELLNLDHDLVSGGTDTHLMLMDLTRLGATGKDTEAALADAGIILNKNTIPFDTRSPVIASGVRIGTPAVTTRGMREGEMVKIAGWIDAVIRDLENEELRSKIRGEVRQLCKAFPVY